MPHFLKVLLLLYGVILLAAVSFGFGEEYGRFTVQWSEEKYNLFLYETEYETHSNFLGNIKEDSPFYPDMVNILVRENEEIQAMQRIKRLLEETWSDQFKLASFIANSLFYPSSYYGAPDELWTFRAHSASYRRLAGQFKFYISAIATRSDQMKWNRLDGT